jgi:hypothetical protein
MRLRDVRLVVFGVAVAAVLGVALAGADAPEPHAQEIAAAAPAADSGFLEGLCEASAIVPWDGGYLIGDNETEDRLHAFDLDFRPRPSRPLAARVEDVEALAIRHDGRLLVVGSQSANKNGTPKPDRERVLLDGASPVRPDLSACAACEAARGIAPKQGGLSIEGAAWWGAPGASPSLWLGVRSPRAMLLRTVGDPAASLRAAEVVPLDLGGYGVRDLTVHDGALYVLAGPRDATDATHAVYRIAGPGAAPERLAVALPAGAEGLLVEAGALVGVTDGDGEPGGPCATPARWFRVSLPAP